MKRKILDFGEFLIAISVTAQQEPKKKLEWAFSMYGMYLCFVYRRKYFIINLLFIILNFFSCSYKNKDCAHLFISIREIINNMNCETSRDKIIIMLYVTK